MDVNLQEGKGKRPLLYFLELYIGCVFKGFNGARYWPYVRRVVNVLQ